MQNFGRWYKIKIGPFEYEVQKGKPAYNIKFDINFARAGIYREGSISILGLSLSTMAPILALTTMDKPRAISDENNIVSLEAGYLDGPHIEIFKGCVWEASVTSPPEMWLNLQVKSIEKTCIVQKTKEFKVKDPPWKKKEIATGLIELFEAPGGGKYGFEDKTTAKIGDVETVRAFGNGNQWTLTSAVEAINGLSARWQCVLDGNYLKAYNRNITEPSINGDIKVSKDTGLLAVSGITVTNADVTTFLDDPNPDLCNLLLQSEKNKEANGKYLILRKRFQGHFEGPEWYTIYNCSNRVG